jgi:uncharacterized membrane protein
MHVNTNLEALEMDFCSRSVIVTALALQFILIFSIYWNIQIVRQVLGFLYLTFVPGIIILKFLGVENLSLADVSALSVGLSLAFLMFVGLLLNELFPLIGFLYPLSTNVLIPMLSLIITLLCVVYYFKPKKNDEGINIRLFLLDKLVLLILICLLILGVCGTLLMNVNSENLFLLLFFFLVPVVFSTVLILRQKFRLDILPITLLITYIAILMTTWLTTGYIFGYDSHLEFYSFKITDNSSIWNPVRSVVEIDKGNAMLSITVLPTIYSKVMDLEAAWIFKIVYPLLAAFVPFALYQFFRLRFKREAAFLGVFLFIIHSIDGLGSIKEWIATIFYVLLFFVIFNDKIQWSKRKILFIVFAGALVVSHYSKSYIFMFILISIWAISFIFKKSAKVTLNMTLIFACMAFVWYIFTLQAVTFEALLRTADNIYRNLTSEFFNPESRGPTVMTALGLIGPPTYLHMLSRVFFYLTVLLLLVGFISVGLKFWKEKSEYEYFILVCINVGLIAMTIILPELAPSYTIGRFYRTALIVLGPLCFFGGEEIIANLHRLRLAALQRKISALFLTCAVLMPFFLFQTGFFYEVAKVECWIIPLSGYRMPPSEVSGPLLYGVDVYGAVWLSRYTDKASAIYADGVAWDRALTSYGLIDYGRFRALGNTTRTLEIGSLIYLRRLNIVHGVMIGGYVPQWNTSDLQPLLDMQNIVYSNGGCLIYKNSEK